MFNCVQYLVVLLKKLLDSLFISSERNLLISSSIFLISASNRSLMLLNSVSITLKSPSLMGISRLMDILAQNLSLIFKTQITSRTVRHELFSLRLDCFCAEWLGFGFKQRAFVGGLAQLNGCACRCFAACSVARIGSPATMMLNLNRNSRNFVQSYTNSP